MAQHISVGLIRGYQKVLSPILAFISGPMGGCRFEPSCSQYAIEAVQTHGTVKGIALATWRICRCAPWGGCGHDPVPPVMVHFGGARLLTSRLARTLAPPEKTTGTTSALPVRLKVQCLKFKVQASQGPDTFRDASEATPAISGGRS